MREGGRIVSVAAIIAVAANTEGRREIVGLGIGPSEAETFWADFLKRLTRRGLRGVKLVISDAHEGLKAAVKRVVGATWQRCRVHFMRNALAYVPKTQETVVAAAIRQAFIQPDRETAGQVWRHVADQLRPRFEKLGRLMDEAEHDVLAYMNFAAQHRTKLHSTNPLERLNEEVKRRADVVGIFPNEESIVRLCLVPGFDGAFLSSDLKDALWARFFMGAPRRQRRSVERYNIVMSGRIWTPPDCKRVWQTLVQGSQLLTYIRLPYAA